LKHSSGTALKFYSDSKLATVGTWLVLVLVTYQAAVKLDFARPMSLSRLGRVAQAFSRGS